MTPADEFKAAFKTHHGHFHFRVMPFSPTTFQCLMNSIFAVHMRKFVLVFVDDIVIYNKTIDEHVDHLSVVFKILQENKLYLKFRKCGFAQSKVEYLGHVVSDLGVATDPSKTPAIVQWPHPQNITDLRGFLGPTSYYRKFVKHYGILAKPLTSLLKQKSFHWPESAETAFSALKQALTNTPVVTLPNFEKTFEIETNA